MIPQPTMEIKQMEEAAAQVADIFDKSLRKGVKRMGEIIATWRPKYGKAFIKLLPEMPPSFWQLCESAFLGVLDERLAFLPDEKTNILKRLPVTKQRDILDNGLIVDGKRVKVKDVSPATLSIILGIGTVQKTHGHVSIDAKPRYEINRGRLQVHRAATFNKADLMEIIMEMD